MQKFRRLLRTFRRGQAASLPTPQVIHWATCSLFLLFISIPNWLTFRRVCVGWREIAAACILSILLSGCASSIPDEIRRAPDNALSIDAALNDPGRFLGRAVRWGGEIKSVSNAAASTRIEVIQRPLYRDGYPELANRSLGRFIMVVDGFVDPVEAKSGRPITVFGELIGTTEQLIGDFVYNYPEIRAENYVLWEPRPAAREFYPHYRHWPWYDPWHDPWYRPWYGPHPRHYPSRF